MPLLGNFVWNWFMKRCGRAWAAGCLLLAAALTGQIVNAAGVRRPEGRPIVVFAAASLTNALQELGDSFSRSFGISLKFSFAASSALARQIESGAPADIYLSADIAWMDYLQTRGLIQTASRHELLGNRLVLIAPAASNVNLKIAPQFALADALGTGRLATGDPDSVPVGRYAREALTALGVWSSVKDRLVRTENVRAALAFVERGEAPLGIVYETDALIDTGVRIVDAFPIDTYRPITYPIALTVGANNGAAQFADFLRTPGAAAVFAKYGFVAVH